MLLFLKIIRQYPVQAKNHITNNKQRGSLCADKSAPTVYHYQLLTKIRLHLFLYFTLTWIVPGILLCNYIAK